MVESWERRLAHWGLGALLVAVVLRHILPWLLWRSPWLLDSQIIAAAVLWSASLAAGSLLSGSGGRGASACLGCACWLTAVSLVPKYLWHLPGGRPQYQLVIAGALLGLALLSRWYMLRRWSLELTGLGWEAVQSWALERPLYARCLAERRLRLLGWRG